MFIRGANELRIYVDAEEPVARVGGAFAEDVGRVAEAAQLNLATIGRALLCALAPEPLEARDEKAA
jgi:hypothetical protein